MKNNIPALFCAMLSGLILLSFNATSQTTKKSSREFYQLTVYHYSTAEQGKVLDDYLQQALLPALHRMNMKKVGVFKPVINDTAAAKRLYVFITLPELDLVASLQDKLNTDKVYLSAGTTYINALNTTAPYNRVEVNVMKAFPLAPVAKLPVLKAPKNERVYELRSYESATEKIFKNKVQMFNEGDEIGLFKKLNFNAIFYSEVIAGSRMPNLIYMTGFENMADRDAHWKSFVDDPYWKKISTMPEYQNNVSHIDITLLHPAEYSDF
ncbi:MAG: NIPSNAP family protein [Chitinophagaceae bacterium]|nr:NIPSNAP family protein [Chitinophagaceae bacterium]